MRGHFRLLSVLLTFGMLLPQFAIAQAVSGQSETRIESRTAYEYARTISDGLIYREKISLDDTYGPQKSFLFEYTPGSDTGIAAFYGEYIYGTNRLSSMIAKVTETGSRVVGGINADFYSLATGVPMSAVIVGGELISSDDGRACMGFFPDQSAIIGYPEIEITLTAEADREYTVGHFNKYPSPYALYLMSDTFALSTKTRNPSTEIILFAYGEKYAQEELPQDADDLYYSNGYYYEKIPAAAKIGEQTKLFVREVLQDSVDAAIPEGAYVLCADNTAYDDISREINEGDEFTLTIGAAPGWERVINAVGGGSVIVEDSRYTDEKGYDSLIYDNAHPRTAAGITADGGIIFYCIDGRRRGYSYGLDMERLSEELITLGCVSAINFDGGGSTVFSAALPGNQYSGTQNKPSDGAERGISTALLFVNCAENTQEPSRVFAYPEKPLLLAGGGSVEITDYLLTDSNYFPVDKTEQMRAVFYPLNDGISVFDRTIVAGDTAGEYAYGAAVETEKTVVSGIAGSVAVVDQIDRLSLSADKTVLYPGESAQLEIEASLLTIPVFSRFSNYLWDLDTELLVPEPERENGGTEDNDAKSDSGSGQNDPPENDDAKTGSGSGQTKPPEDNAAKTDSGFGQTDPPEDNAAKPGSGLGQTDPPENDAAKTDSGLGQTDPPEDNAAVGEPEPGRDGGAGNIGGNPARDGAFPGDSEHAGNPHDPAQDRELAADIGSLTELTADFSAAGAFATLDQNGVLTPLREDTAFTVTAYYGGVAASLDFIVLPYPFDDIKGHWAQKDIMDCSENGLVNGETGPDGTLYYPEREFSRAEFCAVLTRLLGIDTSQYAETQLPYTDIEDIGDWAEPYLKSLYSVGLLGMITKGGAFHAKDSITREDVMTMLGMLCPEDEEYIAEYDDIAQISGEKYKFVRQSLSAGLFEGYEDNTLRPASFLTRAQAAAVFMRLLRLGERF